MPTSDPLPLILAGLGLLVVVLGVRAARRRRRLAAMHWPPVVCFTWPCGICQVGVTTSDPHPSLIYCERCQPLADRLEAARREAARQRALATAEDAERDAESYRRRRIPGGW